MWRELIRYGRYGVGASVLERASEQMPVILIGRFSGSAQLGQYRYAQRIAVDAAGAIVQARLLRDLPGAGQDHRATGSASATPAVRSLRLMAAFSAFPSA